MLSSSERIASIDEAVPHLWGCAVKVGSKEYLLREILENMPQGVSAYDADGCLFARNRRMQEIYDLPDDLMQVGTPLRSIVTFLANRGDYSEGIPEIGQKSYRCSYTGAPGTQRSAAARQYALRSDITVAAGWRTAPYIS
ncbi:MAG: hypothetical protein CMM23_13845 [Rhodospirillaceae bacterium]|nr:hypothetical protein [Rhodospirillaceae bacterium]